jgi:hypothetical protein
VDATGGGDARFREALSRLGKIVGTPAYKSMTIRNWATTMALLERMEAPEVDA